MVLLCGIGKRGGVMWNKGNRLYYMEHDRQLMLYGCFFMDRREGCCVCGVTILPSVSRSIIKGL